MSTESIESFELIWEQVIEAFEQLGIAYHIGGSVASSAFGIFRASADIDLVADFRAQHVAQFVDLLQSDFYLDEEMIREAIHEKSSFNLIHVETGYKVDVFVLKNRPYDRQAFNRAEPITLSDSPDARAFFVAAPEDVILNKLLWYQMGGGVSERQWIDIVGVIKVQVNRLDFGYMQQWAKELDVAALLDRAIAQADAQ